MNKIDTSANNRIFLFNTGYIDELVANQLPLFDTLDSASNKFIMTTRSKANAFYLPGLLVNIRHHCHNLLIEKINHH
jgi:hypothetical protein